MADIVRSILSGLASFFLNPVFYLLVAGLFLFSAQRVRRERRSFHVKAYGMFNTIFRSIVPSLLMGLSGSVLLLVSGTALTQGVIVLFSCAYLVIMLTTQLRFLSPAIAGGLAMPAAWFMPDFQTPFSLINRWISEIREVNFFSLGVFVVVCMLMECLLVYLWGASQSSPRLINSRRGGLAGAHEASELWIVPLLLLLPSPSGPIGSAGPWPFIPDTGSSYGLIMFPLGVGIAQLITHTLPGRAVRETGHWLLICTGFTALFVGLAWPDLHLPFMAVIGGLLALVGRLGLVWYHHYLRESRPFYYTMPNQGIRVIGVIPHTPGARMGILSGEQILQVNDVTVTSEYDFYQALQKNPAYCKLEVLDRFGEPRFVKGTIHEGDSHRIGLLFLEPEMG
ncbi:PDZ domain-containing protein [Sporolactobacillus sp. Y61]|uniref:PDZ domain-containing protein n=1 Tax=Sporolactobacillus sp. Y61 TaxID=3160863 RepID=A0AAU8IC35_9BACL